MSKNITPGFGPPANASRVPTALWVVLGLTLAAAFVSMVLSATGVGLIASHDSSATVDAISELSDSVNTLVEGGSLSSAAAAAVPVDCEVLIIGYGPGASRATRACRSRSLSAPRSARR